MASLRVCPLFGGCGSPDSPVCLLLSVDGCLVLLDCGWTEAFDTELLQPLREVAPTVDVVLLTHPDLAHMGALPYARKHFGLKAPVYATLPVQRMGQQCLYDALSCKTDRSDGFELFDISDIDDAMSNILTVKYSQQVMLNHASGVHVTAYPAGRTLGGCLWKINDDIIYAIDVNLRKERVCGASSLRLMEKPALLITNCETATQPKVELLVRESKLSDAIISSLRGGGNVLIPCDTAGRSLELLFYLNSLWQMNRLGHSYPLVFLHSSAGRTLELARSQLEWMSPSIAEEFDRLKENPFALTNVRPLHTFQEMDTVPWPMCVVCTSESLDTGCAMDLFMIWSSDPRNAVILVKCPERDSLSGILLQKLEQQQQQQQQQQPSSDRSPTTIASFRDAPFDIEVNTYRKMPIEGEALILWKEEQRAELLQARRLEREEIERTRLVVIKEEDELVGSELAAAIEERGEVVPAEEDAGEAPAETHQRLFLPPRMVYRSPFPMFPCIVDNVSLSRRVLLPQTGGGDYGDAVDRTHFVKGLRVDAAMEDGAGAALPGEEDGSRRDFDTLAEEREVEKIIDGLPIPSRAVALNAILRVCCQVGWVDFTGSADGGTLRRTLANIVPRRIVFLRGSETDARFLTTDLAGVEPHLPSSGQMVELQMDANVIPAKLSDDLVQSLTTAKIRGNMEMAFVQARIVEAGNHGNLLVPLVGGHQTIYVGDLRLSDLRLLLRAAGVRAEFDAGSGTIVCAEGKVFIRKSSASSIVIDSAISREYFTIRNIIYSQFRLL